MRLLEINVCSGKLSTGRIVSDIARKFQEAGNEVVIATSYDYKETCCDTYVISNKIENFFDILLCRIFDNSGMNNIHGTKKFVKWIKKFNPDIIHLHNLHGYYLNIKILFNYLKTCNKRIIWTLHDCWPFTGHCTYFDYVKCEKWKNGCDHCSQHKDYPCSLFVDNSKKNFKLKKELFTNIRDLTLVTPSQWLANLVKNSFLKEYPVVVINNGVDFNIFKRTASNLRKKYDLTDKKVLLAVAGVWNHRKGLEDIFRLNQILTDKDNISIVIIGLNNKQLKMIPPNIIGIKKTESTYELTQWYSLADLLINPTYEDNYPTVNLEAQACGCPVVTYKTGGSIESVPKNNVIEQGLYQKIKSLCLTNNFNFEIKKPKDIDYMADCYCHLFLNKNF